MKKLDSQEKERMDGLVNLKLLNKLDQVIADIRMDFADEGFHKVQVDAYLMEHINIDAIEEEFFINKDVLVICDFVDALNEMVDIDEPGVTERFDEKAFRDLDRIIDILMELCELKRFEAFIIKKRIATAHGLANMILS